MPRKERDEKRRDSKGRLLKSGESQRPDGRYAYKYMDTFGNPKFVYSWKLVPTDKIPAGKRPDLSLREKVRQIQQDIADGIDPIGKKMTVCQLYAKYIRQRGNVKRGTKKSREQLMKLLSDDKLGAASIDSVKLSDAKEWALRMQEQGVAYNTICNSKRSLKAIFYMAIQDDCIRKNPFDFPINDVINDDTEPKVPLTPAQEEELLKFMQDDPVYAKYYDEVVILLETGLRISELCGLTETDLNFEKRFVNVDHQLLRSTEDGYYIETPKTDSGFRQVPMSAAAYEAFQRVLKNRRGAKAIEVDGYSNFLFLNRDGLPKVAVNYDAMFKCLAKKFNKCHKEPLPPVMTPHTMRHTFCTRMANAGMNPKALQYIMGHANIVMTLNYYAHATFNSAQAEMERLEAAKAETAVAAAETTVENTEETKAAA
ncbi:site-specific integrase [Bifidobacterium phasiani]|uniref:Site-specific integrase n=1 Tax=Bifidobacterium phasiani TaxID=2834431 RepID=A0ABS6WA83_9BIFI|nr:site-specific integrase [Bifidobacterium phasiani]MBW3083408.1 site-specific integrase [Bifidobacterium phasiani]